MTLALGQCITAPYLSQGKERGGEHITLLCSPDVTAGIFEHSYATVP